MCHAFEAAALYANAVLLGISALLAHRIVQPRLGLVPWMVIALTFVSVTSFGNIALQQNQPQIFVTFLILLALERDRSDAPVAAGLAFALAASIKLYPALFALFWLATRNGRAFLAFVFAGGTLGFLSVGLAGWPLHAAFLHHIGIISDTVLASQINLNLGATFAQGKMLIDSVKMGVDLSQVEVGAFIAGAKPPLLKAIEYAGLLGGLALLFGAIGRADDQTRFRALYPAAIILVAFFSPLTWTHHYLPVALMVPMILDRRHGWLLLGGLTLLFSRSLLRGLDAIPSPVLLAQILGSVGIVALFLLLLQPLVRANSRPATLST